MDQDIVRSKSIIMNVEKRCISAWSNFTEKTNKIRTIWFFWAYIACSLFAVCISWWRLLQYNAQIIGKAAFIAVLPLVVLSVALCLVLLFRWKKYPERVFVVIAVPAVSSLALFIMPNQIPDEIWHIYRAFDLRLAGDEMLVPLSIARQSAQFPMTYSDLYACILASPDWNSTTSVYRDMSTYLVHLYAIPSIVVHICELLNINVFLSIFIARFFNGIAFVLAGYWMIRHIPLGKTVLCIYLLNPMLMQQEASCSADVIVNIASLMFISHVLFLRFQDEIRTKDKVLLLALFLIMSISKYVYALLGFLMLLLVPKISNKKARVGIYVAVCGFVVLCAVFVLFIYQGNSYFASVALLRDPPEFFEVFFNTLYEVGPLWIKETFGLILGALNITVWEPCFWIYCMILFASVVFNLGERLELKKYEKILSWCITIFATMFTILLFREYTIEVDKRSDIIMGAQGRYFIPYFILPFISAITPRASLYRKNVLILYSVILITIYFIDVFFIISAFR